jgi:hypothetical protein
MSRLDWFAMAFLLLLVAALVIAFFLYLRTAYREGGWRQVRLSLFTAAVALAGFYILRTAQNSELGPLKDAVNHLTK